MYLFIYFQIDGQQVLRTSRRVSHTNNKFTRQACASQIKRVLFGDDLWVRCQWCTWQWGAEVLMMVYSRSRWGGDRGGRQMSDLYYRKTDLWVLGGCLLQRIPLPLITPKPLGPRCTSSTFSPQAHSTCCLETATKSSVWSRPLWVFGSPLRLPKEREAHYGRCSLTTHQVSKNNRREVRPWEKQPLCSSFPVGFSDSRTTGGVLNICQNLSLCANDRESIVN